jgi:hypothetical protein
LTTVKKKGGPPSDAGDFAAAVNKMVDWLNGPQTSRFTGNVSSDVRQVAYGLTLLRQLLDSCTKQIALSERIPTTGSRRRMRSLTIFGPAGNTQSRSTFRAFIQADFARRGRRQTLSNKKHAKSLSASREHMHRLRELAPTQPEERWFPTRENWASNSPTTQSRNGTTGLGAKKVWTGLRPHMIRALMFGCPRCCVGPMVIPTVHLR